MKKWMVRVQDESFVEKESFETFEDALKWADYMGEYFGSWNVQVYEA